jgi:hypothetical protein
VAPLPPDPHTLAALLKFAAAFNHDYDTGDYGPVYTRWDARSQAIITRAEYLKRHKDCPSGSHVLSQTESVSPGGPYGAAGTMDPLQRAADAGDLHEWEMSLP